ncbi:hypothetical protein SFC66_11120 [Terribacillus saccharophilus]|uniref:hypothetical protein n=1 Tax=Terribacillus saccharophilus TaxID=361277 RepID=UPI0039819E88
MAEAIQRSKRMLRTIKQNVLFSAAHIGNYLPTTVWPLGTVSHEGSTIPVIMNELKLLKKKIKKQKAAMPSAF